MKKLLFALVVTVSTVSFAEMEPNYYDISEAYGSLQRLRAQCGDSKPGCAGVCSQGINYSMSQMSSGANVSPEVAAQLKQYWWSCLNSL